MYSQVLSDRCSIFSLLLKFTSIGSGWEVGWGEGMACCRVNLIILLFYTIFSNLFFLGGEFQTYKILRYSVMNISFECPLPAWCLIATKYLSVDFLQTRAFSYSHKATIKIWKRILIYRCHLTPRLHSSFTSCPNNILYGRSIQADTPCCVYLSCFSSFLSPGKCALVPRSFMTLLKVMCL